MIRTAMLSFWHVHAAGYAQSAKEHPDVELIAAWDEDAARGRPRSKELGIEFVPDLDALFARKDIDAVIVQCPTSLHRDVIIKAARAGKHVLSDKVLAPTIGEAREIVAATDAGKVVLVTGMSFLYHDYVDRLRTMIGSGEIGRLVNARMMSCHGGAIRDVLPPGFYSLKEAAGGALVDMCHLVYLVPHLFGGMPRSVYARFAQITEREVEDSAFVLFDYPDGFHASIDVGFATKGAPPMEIELNGTEGTVIFRSDVSPSGPGAPPRSEFIKRIGDEKTFTPVPLGKSSPAPLSLWVEHVKAGTRPDDNINRALELSRLNEAAYRSARQGVPVELASVP